MATEAVPPSAPLRGELEGGTLSLTMSAPETRNALSVEMLGSMVHALADAARNPEVRVVVVASSHPTTFSSGGDMSSFATDTPPLARHEVNGLFARLFTLLRELGKPTIAAVNGHCLAGALGIALSCDLVVAKETATFGSPEITVGVFPFMSAALLPRAVGQKRANELLLLGERISAAEAQSLGIVNRVVGEDDFARLVDDWAGRLAARAPVVMQLGKRAMLQQQDLPLAAALEYVQHVLTLAFTSDDLHEGVSAFREKRTPRWSGR